MARCKFKEINTKNLILRKFKESDVKRFYDYRNHPEIRRYQGEGWCDSTLEKTKQFIKKQTNSEPGKPKQWFQIAIELKSTGKLIGDLGIYSWEPDENHTQIFVAIAPDFQQEGFAQEALAAVLDYIFDILDEEQVVGITDVRNRAAVKLLESLDFKSHGDFITGEEVDGEDRTEHLFIIRKEEWRDEMKN